MKITKYLIGSLICLTVLAACGPSGKNRKREPSRQSKKEVVEEKKKETPSEEEVNIEEETSKPPLHERRAIRACAAKETANPYLYPRRRQ